LAPPIEVDPLRGSRRATASNLDTLLDRGVGREVRMLLSFQRPSHLFRRGAPSYRHAESELDPERTAEYSAQPPQLGGAARRRGQLLLGPDRTGSDGSERAGGAIDRGIPPASGGATGRRWRSERPVPERAAAQCGRSDRPVPDEYNPARGMDRPGARQAQPAANEAWSAPNEAPASRSGPGRFSPPRPG
jgi:hypothetical protein